MNEMNEMNEVQKQLVLDYQEIFGLDAGKRVLNDLATRLNYSTRIIPQGIPGLIEFEVGKREGYLYILDKIKIDLSQEVQEVTEMEVTEMEVTEMKVTDDW